MRKGERLSAYMAIQFFFPRSFLSFGIRDNNVSYSSSPFLHGCLIKSKHGRRGGGGSGVVSTHRVDGKPKEEEEEEESHHIYIKTDSCRE